MRKYYIKKIRRDRWQQYRIFWEITLNDTTITERSGSLGAAGKTTISQWQSSKAAAIEAERIIIQKQKEGYGEYTPTPELREWHTSVDSKTEKKFYECLGKLKESNELYYFNPPASDDEILNLEISNNIELPKYLRIFLSHYNGGFIWANPQEEIDLDFYKVDEQKGPTLLEIKKHLSYPLFSVAEIKNLYYNLGEEVIPFLSAYNGELVSVWSVHNKDQESEVIYSDHEISALKWERIYQSFAHFFIAYVESNGKPPNSYCY